MNHAVVLDRVSYRYPDNDCYALREVEVGIPEGAFALVCGATGSGKSTLLRAINGLVPNFTGGTFSGRVAVQGRDTLRFPPRKLADVVAFVPQDPGASFVLERVEDELAYAMENLGFDQARMRRRVEETLDLLDIESLRDRSVTTLSGGERQRVAIAAALTPGAKVLLLDEPTSQLDPQAAEDVLAALQRLVHDLGLTVVIAEHRLDRVAGFVDAAIGCYGDGHVEIGEPAAVLEALQTGPAVSRLGRLLGWRPVPLTVRDARRMAADWDAVASARPSPAPVEPGERLLAAAGVSASYGSRRVLRDVGIELDAGEIVALMGRNGAGKTTLLRTLAGALQPDGGTVTAAGGAVRIGVDVALCPQTPEDVLFSETVVGEITATLEAGPGRDMSVTDLLESLGIADAADRHPRDLSAGERLLTAIGAIVATGAPVLLLDEPTRGLDGVTKERLSSFIRAYVSTGRAVLLASHDVELVAALAHRVVMLAAGEVIADGTPREVLGDSSVFAPQTARVFGSAFMTPEDVAELIPG